MKRLWTACLGVALCLPFAAPVAARDTPQAASTKARKGKKPKKRKLPKQKKPKHRLPK